MFLWAFAIFPLYNILANILVMCSSHNYDQLKFFECWGILLVYIPIFVNTFFFIYALAFTVNLARDKGEPIEA